MPARAGVACSVCFFYDDQYQECRRNPQSLPVHPEHWCGEFKAETPAVPTARTWVIYQIVNMIEPGVEPGVVSKQRGRGVGKTLSDACADLAKHSPYFADVLRGETWRSIWGFPIEGRHTLSKPVELAHKQKRKA
jgi:hypothetical protein